MKKKITDMMMEYDMTTDRDSGPCRKGGDVDVGRKGSVDVGRKGGVDGRCGW